MDCYLLYAAKNVPFPSLATILKPIFLSCKSSEASQFSLTKARGGGCQTTVSCALSLLSSSPTRAFNL